MIRKLMGTISSVCGGCVSSAMGAGFPPDPCVMTSLGFQGPTLIFLKASLVTFHCLRSGVDGSCPDDPPIGCSHDMFP